MLSANNIPIFAVFLAYLCPLCLQNIIMITENKQGLTASFTVDHYPPQNANGKYKILVCKDCNNIAGHNFEHALTEKLDVLGFLNQDERSSIKVSAKMVGMPGHGWVELGIADDKVPMVMFGDEKKLPFIKDWFSQITVMDCKINISKKLPDEKKVRKALLKAAYLYCFEMWGYEFAFSKNAERFRDILYHDEEYPLLQLWKETNIADAPEGVCYISNPADIKAFAVLMHLKAKQTGVKRLAIVLIPNPSESSWEQLCLLSKTFTDKELEFTFQPLNLIELSITPNAYTTTSETLMNQ